MLGCVQVCASSKWGYKKDKPTAPENLLYFPGIIDSKHWEQRLLEIQNNARPKAHLAL